MSRGIDEGIVKVRTKDDRNRTMSAASITEQARFRASALVDREHSRVRSRMVAYENIGRMIGASGHWVRRFVNGYAEAAPSFPVGMNIMALYDQLCARIEADADKRLERANAATKSNQEMAAGLVARTKGEEPPLNGGGR
jgi:hypothetical protein